ncbi:MAG TPA: phosphoenolpyruvate carboxykinase (ATP) [Saprospiraceae bacterium]|nr:phosphoenolpyruvate carboxykinase (ATP) [Saprospiraceae bacterium]
MLNITGIHHPDVPLCKGIDLQPGPVYYNMPPEFLAHKSIERGEGKWTDRGALWIHTGKFTGRSPKDRFFVKDSFTSGRIDWGTINQPFCDHAFILLRNKVLGYLQNKEIFVVDSTVCADRQYGINIRVIAEKPYSALFVHNMFIRLTPYEQRNFHPEWHILCVPDFHAIPALDQTRSDHFVIIDFTEKMILIGGTGYTGEIKKSVFTVLNLLLPTEHNVLPMHCSANEGRDGKTALFFGLSGTGKTTLSTDKDRALIGDDEHGWSDTGIFNFEGGCYAKCCDLKPEEEPEIFGAIRKGALLENTGFMFGSTIPDYSDSSITENTRVSYPIEHIQNSKNPSIGPHPKHIFFLACDAFGVLPPVSKLSVQEARYYFIHGFTSKIAGTEEGVIEPEATFSPCFGLPFLPLSPLVYADMLMKKLEKYKTQVWLINTGWTGGGYGVGKRISLKYTRSIIQSILDDKLDAVIFGRAPIFDLAIPSFCPGIPEELLNPKYTWSNYSEFYRQAKAVKKMFELNEVKYEPSFLSPEESRPQKQVLF